MHKRVIVILRQLASLLAMWSLLAISTWTAVGCAAKKPVNTNPTTPFQQVLLWNTGLAQANQDVAVSIQALQAQGLISLDSARAILTWQFKIAAADKKLTLILQQGQEYTSGQASQVNDLLGDIAASINELISNGLAGVNDAGKRAALAASIQAVAGLGKLIVTTLASLGVLKASAPGYVMLVPQEVLA